MGIEKEIFGRLPDGRSAMLYHLTNNQGASVSISNYGGIVTRIMVPDRTGMLGDVALGFDDLNGYLEMSPYFGAIIGRCANRMDKGTFVIKGKEYHVAANEMPKRNTHLHGGMKGFDKVLWEARPFESESGPALELKYMSPDGEENYPGNLQVTVVYTFTNDNAINIEMSAETDATTIINLTNHSYFNLAGECSGCNYQHEVKINADFFTPVNASLIPTGEILSVKGTPLDFTVAKPIGRDVEADDEQLKRCLGFDHNFVLRKSSPGALETAAEIYEPKTGRTLAVLTTQPAIQFYGGNFLGDEIGKGGRRYEWRGGFCFEPQRYPDSPNHSHFPSVILEPEQKYHEIIVFRFGVK